MRAPVPAPIVESMLVSLLAHHPRLVEGHARRNRPYRDPAHVRAQPLARMVATCSQSIAAAFEKRGDEAVGEWDRTAERLPHCGAAPNWSIHAVCPRAAPRLEEQPLQETKRESEDSPQVVTHRSDDFVPLPGTRMPFGGPANAIRGTEARLGATAAALILRKSAVACYRDSRVGRPAAHPSWSGDMKKQTKTGRAGRKLKVQDLETGGAAVKGGVRSTDATKGGTSCEGSPYSYSGQSPTLVDGEVVMTTVTGVGNYGDAETTSCDGRPS